MELRHIRYFVAVAEALSFTKAAGKLRIAQPSLTRQIKTLEDELHVRLFDRSSKQIKLTREGESFLVGANRLLGFITEIVESCRNSGTRPSVALNIGYVPSVLRGTLPIALGELERQSPEIAINLFGMSPADQLRALREKKLDIGFVGLTDISGSPDLQSQEIDSERAVLLVRPGNRLARKKKTAAKDLDGASFISLSDQCYPGYESWLEVSAKNGGFRLRILEVVETETALVQAMESTDAVALVPERMRRTLPDSVAAVHVEPPLYMQSRAVWRKDNQLPAVQAYLALLKRT